MEEYSETQPLLRRRQSPDSTSESIEESSGNFNDLRSNVKIGIATFWSLLAGITFSGCRILLKHVYLNGIDLTIVSAMVQVCNY